jgi:hypothetical protein
MFIDIHKYTLSYVTLRSRQGDKARPKWGPKGVSIRE